MSENLKLLKQVKMESTDDLDQLEELLCADLEENNEHAGSKTIREVDLFSRNSSANDIIETAPKAKDSLIHHGDTDSSDDEERKNCFERTYDDFGSQVKKTLDDQQNAQRDRRFEFESRLRQTNIDVRVERSTFKPETKANINTFCAPEIKPKTTDVSTDPIFGIRISKPLISSTALLDKMQGRQAVSMTRVKRYVETEDLANDWVIGGVVVKKSDSKKSQKGSNFLIWTLSDLKDDLKTVSMFLFRKAYNDLWKLSEGTVVAILNPNVLERSQNSAEQACLSVDSPDRVMVLGQSKDLGVCKSKKKNGEPCTAFINISQCEHCIYHVKQEYQKFSRRQELQSSTMGKGLVNLQNKLLGKSTMIYGGKAYSALPSGNTKKVKDKDQNRLMTLTDFYKSETDSLMTNKSPHGVGALKNNSQTLHSPRAQKSSDLDRLSKLSNSSPKPQNNISLQTPSLAEKVASSPLLGKGFTLKGSGTIDLNMSYGQKAAERAKLNAIKIIQQQGGIKQDNPNSTKGTEVGKKRLLEKLNKSGDQEENSNKRVKPNEPELKHKTVMSERFKKILEATSAHQNLLEEHDNNEQEKYFNNLEKKEAMEEKMLNTFKLACKAVRCIRCKYTAFSASQKCKDEKHPLKVLDTFKRFFKCGNCKNRTVSLEIIPLHSCSNCNSSKWEKAPMLREKTLTTLSDGLSIRGEEETFIGGQVSCGKNINLLVPDS